MSSGSRPTLELAGLPIKAELMAHVLRIGRNRALGILVIPWLEAEGIDLHSEQARTEALEILRYLGIAHDPDFVITD